MIYLGTYCGKYFLHLSKIKKKVQNDFGLYNSIFFFYVKDLRILKLFHVFINILLVLKTVA